MTTEYYDADGNLIRIDPGTRPRGAPPPVPVPVPSEPIDLEPADDAPAQE